MKDQKVFLLSLGFDGSQEKRLKTIREESCRGNGWATGLTMPPMVVLRALPALPEKNRLFRLLEASAGSLVTSSLTLFTPRSQDWMCLGSSLVRDESWELFESVLSEFSGGVSLGSMGPWDEIASFFGYPYLFLGLGKDDASNTRLEYLTPLRFTRPSLRVYLVEYWERTNQGWYENLRWTMGFERRIRLPKSKKSF
ncbi:MAG: hypothetical protein GW949_03000 [Spirochaetales bacterium]|nr:hypothetical protein [Spirochaetales bacterium]